MAVALPPAGSSTSPLLWPAVASGPSTGAVKAARVAVRLDRNATVAAFKASPAVRDGQYIYIASKVVFSSQSDQAPVVRLDKPHMRQIWLSVGRESPGSVCVRTVGLQKSAPSQKPLSAAAGRMDPRAENNHLAPSVRLT
ncbi:hypothetical protein ACF08N_36360 [Streptomyces sp. NPDC015127]|uniref:hypothetical protein n=1 Tax=Streptomyces sp. NPDC015127 TaxID=3364939 RepID=UPI0036F675E5